MSSAEYNVKTEVFEGPLDLLLSLIEKRKLFINDISLATVTDDFIAYLRGSSGLPVSQTAHFIYIASTLLLIKSKSLLPNLRLTEEEAESVEDLEKRLSLYKRFKTLAQRLRPRFGTSVMYRRGRAGDEPPLFVPDERITLSGVNEALNEVIQNFPPSPNEAEATVQNVISLEEMIENLTERIQKSIKLSFQEFSGTRKEDRINVIVSFLALLELVKRDFVNAEQSEQFGDIHLHNRSITTPRYGS